MNEHCSQTRVRSRMGTGFGKPGDIENRGMNTGYREQYDE